jgi:hypothetical protein
LIGIRVNRITSVKIEFICEERPLAAHQLSMDRLLTYLMYELNIECQTKCLESRDIRLQFWQMDLSLILSVNIWSKFSENPFEGTVYIKRTWSRLTCDFEVIHKSVANNSPLFTVRLPCSCRHFCTVLRSLFKGIGVKCFHTVPEVSEGKQQKKT